MTDFKKPIDAQQKVESKSKQIVELIATKIEARMECYKRIRDHVEESYRRYYERHPDRALDDRGADGTEWSMNGLQSILNILGDYNITYRDGVNEIPLSVQMEEYHEAPKEKKSPIAIDNPEINPLGVRQVT